jgi:NitT/TauT family transport system ATP-binding protein
MKVTEFKALDKIVTPAVELKQVSKRFPGQSGATLALQEVSFAVGKGEFISIIGPSGCGKSTVLNLAAGLMRPDAGTVLFDGAPVNGPNQRVGYMTQDDALFPWRSVLDNVALPLEIRRVPKTERLERAHDILQRVGLAEFSRHLPSQLSGGMRKRVSLARTLVYGPEFLLLDEPFSALDAQTRIVIQFELKKIIAELGLTVILVTHDLHEAIGLSDRVLVFSRRPARLIDSVWIARSGDGELSSSAAAREEIYAHLWHSLTGEQETAIV